MATTAIVKEVEPDKAKGSEGGVDDHTIKFPGTTEPAVRAKVASR